MLIKQKVKRLFSIPITSFATQAKTAKKLTPKSNKFKPVVCVSEYGDLLNVKPMTKLKPVEQEGDSKEDLRQVFMINDNQDYKGLIKKMNHNPKA